MCKLFHVTWSVCRTRQLNEERDKRCRMRYGKKNFYFLWNMKVLLKIISNHFYSAECLLFGTLKAKKRPNFDCSLVGFFVWKKYGEWKVFSIKKNKLFAPSAHQLTVTRRCWRCFKCGKKTFPFRSFLIFHLEKIMLQTKVLRILM
jgi:hypothetical protein